MDIDERTDLVVGGGIAGSALARAAARAGLGVTVLERQTVYRDKVRGEYLHPWGVTEARRLNIENILLAAGGSWVTEAVGYDEVMPATVAEQFPLHFQQLVPTCRERSTSGTPRPARGWPGRRPRPGPTSCGASAR